MPVALGIAKVVSFKKQVAGALPAFQTPATGSGGYNMRRVTSDLSLNKAQYESAELDPSYQRLSLRSGVRSVEGSINGELSPGSYQLPFAAILHRDFTAVASTTAVVLTVGTPVLGVYPITRAAGSWITDGVKIGMICRVTAGLAAGSLNRNLLIVGETATILSVVLLDGGTALAGQSSIAGCTVTYPGKRTYVPDTGHTDDSYTIEHWHPDISQSEVFNGCKFSQASLDLPPTGIATVNWSVMGRDMTVGTSQVLTSPTALSGSVVAAVNGAATIDGVVQALLTGLSFSIDAEYSADPVVGSNVYPDVYKGRVVVKGQATVLFQDAVVRDLFVNETEVGLVFAMTTGSSGTADFISFSMPKVKFMNAQKSDGAKGLVMTMPFECTMLSTGGAAAAHDKTTLMIHDSLAAV